jgi:hypothetical protein
MYKNPWWLGFIILFSCVTVLFTGRAAHQIYLYTHLNASVLGNIDHWSVHQSDDNKFRIQGQYSFHLEENLYIGTAFLHAYLFSTEEAAHEMIQSFNMGSWKIWYDPSNPWEAQLDRPFPVKGCAYAGILISLLISFIAFGFYARRGEEEAVSVEHAESTEEDDIF